MSLDGGGFRRKITRMPRHYYTCPDTNRALGLSISVHEVDEVAEEWPHVEVCPRCGNEHYLSLDELYPEANEDGGDGSGVREPRLPPPSDDEGQAYASR